jgi:hypothetical protein
MSRTNASRDKGKKDINKGGKASGLEATVKHN